jgi:hypothetical protein
MKDFLIDPTDIAMLGGMYFVTAEASIIVLDINFKKGSFTSRKIERMVVEGGTQSFREGVELRAICASDDYLYVAEKGGRLLCLHYDKTAQQLEHIDEIPSCSPVALAHHAGIIIIL